MWSTLGWFIFIIVLVTDPTRALDDEDSYDEQHGNHSLIQPSQSSFSVNLDARELTTVTIQTPRFPKKYPSKTQVNWNVKAACDMELYCPDFKLRPRNNNNGICTDYLEIEDGVNITRYCGKELNGRRYISYSPQMDLTFKSSFRKNKRFIGFNCTISCLNHECNCGVYKIPVVNNDKIVGGQTAKENQFPWQAVIVEYGSTDKSGLICGGSLINNQWVLTAAHCTDILFGPGQIQILLGAQCWSNPPPGMLRLDVLDIIQHPEYNPTTFDTDIALIKLNESIDFFHTQFRPVCLPINNTDPIPDEDDVEAVISGFGRLGSGDPLPNCLQYATVDTITNILCQFLYSNELITGNMICAAYPGVDSCQGDSGGPMTTNATSVTFPLVDYAVQIGVVSWGYGCADPDFPGVYARVSAYIGWINNNTAGSSTCPPP